MDESFLKIKGKKICAMDSSKNFGRLSDILVSKGTNRIIALIAKNDALVYKYRMFDIIDVVNSDELNIFVKSSGERFVRVIPIEEDYLSCDEEIYKRKAVLPDGCRVGKIQDINIDLCSGQLTGFEIGNSLAQDLLNGRKLCRTRNTINFSKGNIVLENQLLDSDKRKKHSSER